MKLFTIAIIVLISFGSKAQTIMNIHQNNGTLLQIPLSTIDSITYTIISPGQLASIVTLPIGSITDTSATSGGNIIDDGGTTVTQRGVVWDTTPNPTTANNQSFDGIGIGNYTSNLTSLVGHTIYYVRAYATNSAGTSYGNQLQFATIGSSGGIVSNPGSGVTFDGITYRSIILGNGQEWFADNLSTTIYANGDQIPNVTDPLQWNNLVSGAWVNYDNDSQYNYTYGKLYNWYTIADSRNICPNGWHVPSDSEWNSLIGYLDSTYNPIATGSQSATAGGKMKTIGTQYWQNPNIGASNESGFSGLPGGMRDFSNGSFYNIGLSGSWYSSTEYDANSAWYRNLSRNNAAVTRYNYDKRFGFSVRCLKD